MLRGEDLSSLPAALAQSYDYQRTAQFWLDFVEAENSTGIHAPQESMRILTESVDFSRKGQMALRGIGRASGTRANNAVPGRLTQANAPR